MAGTSSSIQALSKENYDTWKIQMEALLIQKKLWRFAEGTSIKPAEASGNEEAIAKWTEGDQSARASMILAIAPSELKSIKTCKTARELWLRLEEIYASKGPARKATLLKSLFVHK